MKLRTEFTFDAAHRLVDYQGKCSNLHGHIWKVIIGIKGTTENLDNVGILWDFTNAKKLKELLDHKTILKECEENIQLINAIRATCNFSEEDDPIYLMDKNPTAENLCEEIIDHLKTSNPDLTYGVKVYESPKSYAEVIR